MSQGAVSLHAALRWAERIQPGATMQEANRELRAFWATGRETPKPTKWMRAMRVQPGPNIVFVVHPEQPGTALVVDGGRVVTVLSREQAKRTLPGANERASRAWRGGAAKKRLKS